MVQVAQLPPGLHPDPIFRHDRKILSPRPLVEKIREIDTGRNGKLQGSPEPCVYLHQFRGSIPLVDLEFYHRYTAPVLASK